MQIGLSEQWGAWTFLEVTTHEEISLAVSIFTEEDSLQDFIVGFKIKGRRDIDRLDYNSLWMRYLNSAGTITINPIELETDISFRIIKSKTIIFSMDMHFYDEVYEHLTMPEDFKKYIADNDRMLFAASENRHYIGKR